MSAARPAVSIDSMITLGKYQCIAICDLRTLVLKCIRQLLQLQNPFLVTGYFFAESLTGNRLVIISGSLANMAFSHSLSGASFSTLPVTKGSSPLYVQIAPFVPSSLVSVPLFHP